METLELGKEIKGVSFLTNNIGKKTAYVFDIEKLTNLQIELLHLFTNNVSEDVLIEIRKYLNHLLLQDIRNEINQIWEEKNYNVETFNKMLNEI